MKKLASILGICLVIMTFSCSGDDDGGNTSGDNEFQGSWSGIYSGDEEGTWALTINSEGVVSGLANNTLTIAGTITNQGDFSATVGTVTGGFTFIGAFAATTASGTWTNSDDLSGSWSGTKN
jgi:hypothetical protein